MTDADLQARQLASQQAAYRAITSATPDGRIVDAGEGVVAHVVPVAAERSVFNAVLYEEPRALAERLEDLDRLYVEAGVLAWTVWGRPGDEAAAGALAAAGHVHDGAPMLMGADLGDIDLEPRAGVAIDEGTWAEFGACNDAAYDFEEPVFERVFAHADISEIQRYVAREDGRALAVAGAHAHDGDCGITFVATLPEARGRGLASELLRAALRDARDAGCTTTTLEASALGEPVYARLGYRSLGRLGMWERRRPAR